MRAFITGSQCYGEPRPDSDVDLVVLVGEETREKLIALSDNETMPCMFGKLNLIPVTEESVFTAWQVARDACMKEDAESPEPISRDRAIELHQEAKRLLECDLRYGG